MSEPLTGIVVSHGRLAEALVDAVQEISGVRGALVPITNEGCDCEGLEAQITDAAQGRAVVLFVDLAGGSCTTSAARLLPKLPGAALVTGVNLPMLVDFVFHREVTSAAAANRAVDAATKGIRQSTL